MKNKKILFLSLLVTIFMCVFLYYPKYSSLEKVVFKNFHMDKTKLILVSSYNKSSFKQTQDKDKIMQLQNYLKSLEVKKISELNFNKKSSNIYYCANICGDSGLLYQISIYNRYISIVETHENKHKDDIFYLELKRDINIDFLEKYFKSLENLS